MCHPRGHHGHAHPHAAHCQCGCWESECGPGSRRFFSRSEKKECLESYKEGLEKELDGVKERIQELEKK